MSKKEIHKYQTCAIASSTEFGLPDDAKISECPHEKSGMILEVKGVFLADCLGIFIAYIFDLGAAATGHADSHSVKYVRSSKFYGWPFSLSPSLFF